MDEDAYSEPSVEAGEVDDLRERGGIYYNCNREPEPNRPDPDEELYKNQTPSRPVRCQWDLSGWICMKSIEQCP